MPKHPPASPGAYSKNRIVDTNLELPPDLSERTPIRGIPIPQDPTAPVDQGTMRMQLVELARALRAGDDATRQAKEEEREREKREDRRWLLRNVLAPVLLALVGGGGGVTIWQTYFKTDPAVEAAADAAKAATTVEDQIESVRAEHDSRLNTLEMKLRLLATLVIDQQLTMEATVDYVGAKIDAISPKAAKVELPPTLVEARRKSREIQRVQLVEEALATDRPQIAEELLKP